MKRRLGGTPSRFKRCGEEVPWPWRESNTSFRFIESSSGGEAFVLARLTLWKTKNNKTYFRGSVVLRTMEHSRTDQIKCSSQPNTGVLASSFSLTAAICLRRRNQKRHDIVLAEGEEGLHDLPSYMLTKPRLLTCYLLPCWLLTLRAASHLSRFELHNFCCTGVPLCNLWLWIIEDGSTMYILNCQNCLDPPPPRLGIWLPLLKKSVFATAED
jgi:hypothetical protein